MSKTMMRSILTTICALGLAWQTGCQASAPPLSWIGARRIATLPGYDYARLPALSPDGEHLAILGAMRFDDATGLVMFRNMTSDVWISIQVKDGKYPEYPVTYLSWDLTSTRLLFGDGDTPLIYDLTTNVVEPLNPGSERYQAIWGPGDNQVTKYILKPAKQDPDQDKRVEILNLTDNSKEHLFALDWGDPFSLEGMDWSPDGKQLLFSAVGPTAESDSYNNIIVFDRQTATTRALVNTEANETHPHWSPDGQWFVYLAHQVGTSGSELVMSSVDGKCVIRESVGALLRGVDWGPTDQLAVVYANALFLVDMREAFGFGLDDLASHCENP